VKDSPRIVVDTREQLPWTFPHDSIVGTLKTGDYSLEGFEDRVCVERKSLSDAYGTLGKGRERFVRELGRMESFDLALIVIESTLPEFIMHPPKYSRAHPKGVANQWITLGAKHKAEVQFPGGREWAEVYAYRRLMQWWKYHGA